MNAVLAPRAGSSLDNALRAIKRDGGRVPRAQLAMEIERDDDEVDGLLRYGVRMGLLARTEADGEVWYALGDGVPLQEPAPPPAPVIQPVPRGFAAKRKGEVDDDEGDGGRTRGLAREGDDGGSRQRGQADDGDGDDGLAPPDAGLLRSLAPRAAGEGVAQLVAPGGYRPRPGSQVEKVIEHLRVHAPCGGDVWLSSVRIEGATVVPHVSALLVPAIKRGAVHVKKADGRMVYQTGNGHACAPAPAAAAAPAVPFRPAPAPAPAPVAPRAPPAAPAPEPTGSALASHQLMELTIEAAKEMLAHLDVEIGRCEHNLRILQRRRAAFAAVVSEAGKGAAG